MIENGPDGAGDFFVAGGTLRYNSPSYVKRPADEELFQAVSAGEFCYVLTPRQMGKSSLMVRTSRRLQKEGVRTAILDLTSIGTEVTAEQWYLGLVNRLATRLRMRMDVQSWWEERDSIGVVQRFSDFLGDEVLEQIDGQVVVFVDEIDATLNVPFSDDFFAAIRAFYNERADNAKFDRLSFVLLGVATPADLIKDRTRTPFNIGRRIDLKEFSHDDAGVLRDGMVACYPQQGQAIFNRVFYWTNGHPYLTQRLCLSAAEQEGIEDGEQWVDQAVGTLFLAEAARRETNLQFIRDYIGRFPPQEQRLLLDLYGQVHSGQRVLDDDRSIPQNQLKLLGLVQAEGDHLVVRNQIYGHVFNREWIKETRPIDWNRRIAFIAVGAVILLAAALAYFFWNQNQVDTARVIQDAEEDFATGIPVFQLRALAGLFEWDTPETIDTALNLMDGIGQEERMAIFAGSGEVTNLEEDVRSAVIPFTLIMLSTQNAVDESVLTTNASPEDDELLMAMAGALERSGSEENERFARGINKWLAGRQAMDQENWVRASINLSDANSLRLRGNPAILHDIASVHFKNGRHEEALAELTEIMALQESSSDYSSSLLDKSLPYWQSGVEEMILTERELYDTLWENPQQYPELIAMVPTPTATPLPTLTPTPQPAAAALATTAPSATSTESPSSTVAATQTPIPTTTPDMTATFLASCTKDLEVVDEHTYSNNTNLWAPTNAFFDLHWTLRNSGSCPWPADLNWKFIEGEDFGYTGDPIPLEREISPGETIELETQRLFRAPAVARYYTSTWQLVDADENLFGPPYTFAVGITRLATATPTPRPTSATVAQPTLPPSSGGGSSSGGGDVNPPDSTNGGRSTPVP